jgi:hypothetical protein
MPALSAALQAGAQERAADPQALERRRDGEGRKCQGREFPTFVLDGDAREQCIPEHVVVLLGDDGKLDPAARAQALEQPGLGFLPKTCVSRRLTTSASCTRSSWIRGIDFSFAGILQCCAPGRLFIRRGCR